MQIGCTKNLLTTLDVKAAEKIDAADLFCWSANLLTIKRRKAVVVVNDSNRYGFVLYGLKARDFSQLKPLIEDGIRRCLAAENISEAVIQAYFEQADDLVFTKTRGRVAVARLNKACERADLFDDWMDTSARYQTDLSRMINSELFKPDKTRDYSYPYELLLADFQRFYGGKIISIEAADLLIKLDLGATSASRRLLVPLGITFADLHKIIQVAFDWRGVHLHGFMLLDDRGQPVLNLACKVDEIFDPLDDGQTVWDQDVRIDDSMKKRQQIRYTYDYGDNWCHEITVLDVVSDYDKNYPICIMAEGNRPPEDVGGIPGYEAYQTAIGNPDHPDHAQFKSWAASHRNPAFDLAITNRQLRHVLKR